MRIGGLLLSILYRQDLKLFCKSACVPKPAFDATRAVIDSRAGGGASAWLGFSFCWFSVDLLSVGDNMSVIVFF